MRLVNLSTRKRHLAAEKHIENAKKRSPTAQNSTSRISSAVKQIENAKDAL